MQDKSAIEEAEHILCTKPEQGVKGARAHGANKEEL